MKNPISVRALNRGRLAKASKLILPQTWHARAVAEAFVEFLLTKETQTLFADYGLRSVDLEVATATTAQYPPLTDQFTIDYFGGWAEATPKFFADSVVKRGGQPIAKETGVMYNSIVHNTRLVRNCHAHREKAHSGGDG